jgi:ribosomal protein S10
MPPFQYRTVQDPYVGDITRLMGAGPEAEARSIRDIGNIRAEEAQQKGVIRANLVQGLGQTVNEGYTAYRDDKADKMWAGFLAKLAARSDTDPDIEVPELPALTPRVTTSETGEISDQTLQETVIQTPSGPQTGVDRIDFGSSTWEGPTTTQTFPYEGAPQPTVVPETPGVLGDMTGAAPQLYTPVPGRFFQNVTNHGLHDIEALRAEAAREGMSGDQMARKIAESTEHNKGVTAFNTENRLLEMSDLEIQQEAIVATILGNNPYPTAELRDTLMSSPLGPKKGLEYFQTYAEATTALEELQQNNFANARTKFKALVAASRLSGNPRVQGVVLNQMLRGFEEVGIPIPPEWHDKTPDEWDMIIDEVFPGEEAGLLPKQVALLSQEYRDAVKRFGPDHPRTQAIAKELSVVEAQQLRAERRGMTPEQLAFESEDTGAGGFSSELMEGPTLYDSVSGWGPAFTGSGPVAAGMTFVGSLWGIGDFWKSIPGPSGWIDAAQRTAARFRLAENQLVRELVNNPRFPMAERLAVKEAMDISLSIIRGQGDIKPKLVELSRVLRRQLSKHEAARDNYRIHTVKQAIALIGAPEEGADEAPTPTQSQRPPGGVTWMWNNKTGKGEWLDKNDMSITEGGG